MKLTTIRSIASLTVGMGLLSSAQGALWTSGHGDISLAFEGEGLEFEAHLGEGKPAIVDGVPFVDHPVEADSVEISISNTFILPVGLASDFLTQVGADRRRHLAAFAGRFYSAGSFGRFGGRRALALGLGWIDFGAIA